MKPLKLFRTVRPSRFDRKVPGAAWPRWERELLAFLAKHGFDDTNAEATTKGIYDPLSDIAKDMHAVQTWRNVVWVEVIPHGIRWEPPTECRSRPQRKPSRMRRTSWR